MTNKKNAARSGTAKTANENTTPHYNSTASQRARLLKALQQRKTVTTEFARNGLQIYSPAPRILELRKQGYNIITHMERHYAADGMTHNMARYILIEKQE